MSAAQGDLVRAAGRRDGERGRDAKSREQAKADGAEHASRQGGESGDFIFFWVVASYLDNRLPAKVQISRLDDFVDRLESTKLIVDII